MVTKQRFDKEMAIIKIATKDLSAASLEYLTGLAEGIKLARETKQGVITNAKNDKKQD